MNHNGQFYDNGLPYLPLYESSVEGFKQDINFVDTRQNKKSIIWEKPFVLVVSINDKDYGEILEKYGAIKVLKYVIAPDSSEFWIVTANYYIRVGNISGDIQKALPSGNVQCVVASKSQPVCMPFVLMPRK